MAKLVLLYTPLAILLLLFALLARTYLVAACASRKDRSTVARLLRERRAVDFIFKQFGAVAAIVAAVVAALYGFVQFTEDEEHKEYLQQEKEFSQSIGQLYSDKQEESIGGIVAISQLAHSDANRHWEAIEALTGYIRSTVPLAPKTNTRIPRNRDPQYNDPPVSAQPEVEFSYEPVNDVRPANTVPQIGAQMALTAIGIRNLAFEQRQKIQDIPRASIYLKPETPADDQLCKRENVIKQLNDHLGDQTLMQSDRDAANYLIITDVHHICFMLQDIPRKWINLSHSKFVAMNLDNLVLDGVTFEESDISFAQLDSTHLVKAVFKNSSLVGAYLWAADLREADFRWADVRGANLGGTKLGLAWMSGGNFYRANFYEANLENASLVGANMQDLQTMSGSNMDGVIGVRADFSNARISGPEPVSMKGAYLRGSIFHKTILHGVDLRNTDFEKADLKEADLTGADLKGANMAGADLQGAILVNTDLQGVDLTQTFGLTRDQIAKAKLDTETRLPRELASASLLH
jgi:uncharacterized protein YjbI with pentapeptide repeats